MPFDGYEEEKLPVLEEWQKVLLRAADLIEHVGWTQGRLADRRGFCAAGAITVAMTGELGHRTLDDIARFEWICARVGFGGPNGLARYNDFDCLSGAEMVALLRARAVGLEHETRHDDRRSTINFWPAVNPAMQFFSTKPKLKYQWIDEGWGNTPKPTKSPSAHLDAMIYALQIMKRPPPTAVTNMFSFAVN